MKDLVEEFLSLEQISAILKLDPRTVSKVASSLGGRRIGYCWRFKLSAVLEYFDNAKFENRQGKPMDGTSRDRRQTSCLQVLSGRKKTRPRMESRQTMGGGAKEADIGWDSDPYGLGSAYGVGQEIS